MQNQDTTQVTIATFDKLADCYAEKYFGLDVYDSYLEQFANRIEKQGVSVLDVACGPGNVSAYLATHRPDLNLLGIDLAEGMVRQARLKVPSVEFQVRDCRCIDELGEVFEAAAFAFGLNYLTDRDAESFFDALKASLSNSGMLYLATITGEPGWSGIETSDSGNKVYMEYRSVDDVVSMVEGAGFRVDFQKVIASPANASKSTQDLILIAQRQK